MIFAPIVPVMRKSIETATLVHQLKKNIDPSETVQPRNLIEPVMNKFDGET